MQFSRSVLCRNRSLALLTLRTEYGRCRRPEKRIFSGQVSRCKEKHNFAPVSISGQLCQTHASSSPCLEAWSWHSPKRPPCMVHRAYPGQAGSHGSPTTITVTNASVHPSQHIHHQDFYHRDIGIQPRPPSMINTQEPLESPWSHGRQVDLAAKNITTEWIDINSDRRGMGPAI
jgi:hypothetical protein